MKSGEDFRQAMGQADDGFVRVITKALHDLQLPRKKRGSRRYRSVSLAGRQERISTPVSREA